jgi:fibronectin type 3 domain-containing protein/lysophospholipase L1-like esterase
VETLETRRLLAIPRIMPLGDSITEGWQGRDSYRPWLWNLLAEAGHTVDFVGNRTGIAGGLTPPHPNYDQNHQGTAGWRADQLQAFVIPWANANPPDIVLVHTGTNDINQGQSNASTETEIRGIIDNLRTVVPNVKILLAQIIPLAGKTSQVIDLNNRIANIVTSKTTAQSPVIKVDHYTGFNTANQPDGVHPDAAGEQFMAGRWNTALGTVLGAPTPPPAGTYLGTLTPTQQTNGVGPIEINRSVNDVAYNDGRVITLNGVSYMRGIGTHANADVRYNIAGLGFSEFRADIGVDDEATTTASLKMQVYVDNVLRYDSGTMTATTATQSIAVSVAGASTLRLVTNDGGDGSSWDHGDWANARLVSGPIVQPPAAPSSLNATASNQQINLSWTDNASDESGFRVERKTGAGGTYAQIAQLPAGATSHSDTTAAVGTTYFYRVYAYNGGGSSGFSNEASATIPVPPPAAPSNLTANAVNQQINLAWTDSSNNESGFRVERKQGAGGTYAQIAQLAAGATGHADTTAAAGTTYVYRVYAFNSGGASDFSNEASAAVVAPPAAPANLVPTVVDQQVNLSWTDNSGNETGIRVERKTSAGGTYAQIAQLGANVTSYSDTTVSTGATYFYRVYAYNSGGNSTFSNEVSAAIPVPPGTYYLSDLPWVSSANFWGPVERDQSNGERNSNDGRTITLNGVTYAKGIGMHAAAELVFDLGGQYAQFLSDVGLDDETGSSGSARFMVYLDGVLSYDSGVMNGNTATKQIDLNTSGKMTLRLVLNDGGNGPDWDHGDWAGARVVAAAPAAPTNLSATVVNQQIDLSWTDNSSNEVGFRVERRSGASGAWGQIADLGAGVTSYSDTAAAPGTTYWYRVYAYGLGAPSGFSDQASAVIPAPPNLATARELTFVSSLEGWGSVVRRARIMGEIFAGEAAPIVVDGEG